jgi:LAS superfamily LD-carboxypeptidase LdcB
MSGSNGTGVATHPSSMPEVEHWAFQVDSPFRSPTEIQGLTSADESLADPREALAEVDEAFSEVDEAFGEADEAFGEADEAFDSEGFNEADEALEAEADLLSEAQPSEHPLASIFTLPRLAFDALVKGGWQTAVAIAIGAGYRDVNKLTNMVFWFRHPQLIGQRLEPEERDLAREWLDIRDNIVKPALAGASPVAPPPPSAAPSPAAPSWPSPTTVGGKQSIPSSGLRWYGPGQASPQRLDFMRRVYDLHVKRSSGDFVSTLPESHVATIEGRHRAQMDAAAKAKEMLAAARADLAREGLAEKYRIGITSAYRSASQQFDIWQGKGGDGRRGFPHYYHETTAARRRLGDEHGDKAAAYLAAYQGKYIAAPGYSNHQDGLALDLGTGLVGSDGLGKIGPGAWFHKWLNRRAREFQFKPYEAEAWHWVYYGPKTGPQSETWEASEAWPTSEGWASETASTAVQAGRLEVSQAPLLANHRGKAPDIILRWNDMPSVPAEIDVVVHLHGYSWARMTLPKHMEVWSGLDLAPVDGATGSGRSRPTLTVLPRGHYTGEKRGRIYKYTFPALTTRDGLTKLINISLDRFAGQVGVTAPKVGRLILTAHSGGGAPLMTILRYHDPHEVHVFDGLYQDASSLANWASRHLKADRAAVQAGSAPTGAMRVFFGPGTRKYSMKLFDAMSAELRSAPGTLPDLYRVEGSTLGHFQIPRQYGWRVLANAAADVPNARRPTSGTRPAARKLFESEFEDMFDSTDAAEVDEALEGAWQLEEAAAEPEFEDPEAESEYEAETESFDGLEEADFEEPDFEEPEGEFEADEFTEAEADEAETDDAEAVLSATPIGARAQAGLYGLPSSSREDIGERQVAGDIDWCNMRRTIAATARAELARWTRPDGTKILESSPSMLPVLTRYWATVPGFEDPAAARRAAQRSAADDPDWPWSAAFICWVMHTAGVRRAHGFEFGRRHLDFIVGALRNRERSDRGRPFWLTDHVSIEREVRVETGDLVCFNRCCPQPGAPATPACPRGGSVMTEHTYSSLRRRYWMPNQNRPARGCSHTAIVVGTVDRGGTRFLETIGGNESNSVRLNSDRVRVNASGGIEDPLRRRVFGVIKIVGC